MQTGTASWIEPFTVDQLTPGPRKRLANSQYSDAKLDAANPLPPIEHVIYIVKENRTYDQVLGDMKEGNGDPSLVLFGEQIVTPNHHKLAREFVLLDNFYVNADVSADGHNWSTAAIAPDYVQKMWPNSYANRPQNLRFRGSRTRLAAAGWLPPGPMPPPGFPLATSATWWTTRVALGVPTDHRRARPGAGQGHQPLYRGFDLDYPDVQRAKVFLSELAEYEKTGTMPRLIVMRLGNDHTSGTAGKIGRPPCRCRQRLRWAGSSRAFQNRPSGPVPRSSSWKTTRRTARTTWTRTARRPSRTPFTGDTQGGATAPCTTPRPCCEPWNSCWACAP